MYECLFGCSGFSNINSFVDPHLISTLLDSSDIIQYTHAHPEILVHHVLRKQFQSDVFQ